MKTKFLSAYILCLLCTSLLFSQAPVANYTSDAKSIGIAGTSTATPATYNAIFENTAALPFADQKISAGLSYRNIAKNKYISSSLYQTSGYYKINKRISIAAGIKYVDGGKIHFTDASGNPLETIQLNQTEAAAGMALKLTEHFAASLDVKMLRENQGDFVIYDIYNNELHVHPGSSIGGDLGLYYKNNLDTSKNRILTAGLTINNIGSKLEIVEDRGEYLPAILRIGAGYAFDINKNNNIGIYADINKLLTPSYYQGDEDQNGIEDVMEYNVPESILLSFSDSPAGFKGELNEMSVSLGLVYTCQKTFSLRSGILLAGEDSYPDDFFTVGAGYRLGFLEANIAFLEYLKNDEDFQGLDHKLMLSVNVNFGEI